jgi:splicing factor 3A subunit 1
MPVTGIIRPPPEIRAVADKTALFVAKNGRAFEQRILNSDKGQTPKFAFLHESSPFHAYYEDRIIFYQEGGTDDPKEDENKSGKQEQKKEDVITTAVIKKPAQQHEKKSALDPVAKALHKQRNIIRAQYEQAEKEARDSKGNDSEDAVKSTPVVITPPVLLSFVHITAPGHVTVAQVETIKLVAQFTALDESKNFLQNLTMREWNNPAFGFLQPRHAHFAYFSALTDSYKQILQIGFRKGDDEPAMSIEECLDLAAYRAEYEQDAEQRQENNGDDQDEGNAIDWHDFVVVETIDFAKDEVIQPISMPGEVNEMDESDEEGETIRVVPSYTPRVVASNEADKSMTHVIDPITGKSVPVSQTSEHMRIQLLDPKWAEERKKFQEKQKESNLVSGDVIAANLSRVVGDFASTVRFAGYQRVYSVSLSLMLWFFFEGGSSHRIKEATRRIEQSHP